MVWGREAPVRRPSGGWVQQTAGRSTGTVVDRMIENEKTNLQTQGVIVPSAGFDTIRDHTTDDQIKFTSGA